VIVHLRCVRGSERIRVNGERRAESDRFVSCESQRQDETRRDETRRDETRRDETRRETSRHKLGEFGDCCVRARGNRCGMNNVS